MAGKFPTEVWLKVDPTEEIHDCSAANNARNSTLNLNFKSHWHEPTCRPSSLLKSVFPYARTSRGSPEEPLLSARRIIQEKGWKEVKLFGQLSSAFFSSISFSTAPIARLRRRIFPRRIYCARRGFNFVLFFFFLHRKRREGCT